MNNFKLSALFLLQFSASSIFAQTVANQPLSAEKREQHIQKAAQLRKDERFAEAILQLDTIILHNPSDGPMLLFKGDMLLQSKRFSDAVVTYKKLVPLNYESTIAKINLSYALFMGHQPANALHYAQLAWQPDQKNTNAVINYFNAMLWNIKVKQADKFLQEQKHLLTPPQILVLQARLYTTAGDYNKGLSYYDTLVKTYPDKNYVQEYAEVLLGKKEWKLSAQAMYNCEADFSKSEYNAYTQKVKAMELAQAGTEFVYFKDIAQNTRIENAVWWQQGDGKSYRITLKTGISNITSPQNETTNAQYIYAGVTERCSKAFSGQTDLTYQRIKPNTTDAFTGLTGSQTIKYQPNDHRMVGVQYSTDILNFTASLLGKNIRSSNLGYVTHILITGKDGFYSQGSYGMLNDNNSRIQFFGSLYHLFRTEPTLKGGLNFSYLHFKDSTITNYFSPNRYLSTEVFVDYSTALPNLSKFYLQIQAAVGSQKIEQQSWQPNYRFMSQVGMRLYHFETSLKYQTSNVASSTGTGYKFNWFTLGIVYKW